MLRVLNSIILFLFGVISQKIILLMTKQLFIGLNTRLQGFVLDLCGLRDTGAKWQG